MNVVVVESPAKAKAINKYLGNDFVVLASFGHVRDLPSKDGSVQPDEGFSMAWEVDAKSKKRIRDIADAVRKSDKLFLATDPDREGEAISWHVYELLNEAKALKNVEVKRVVFNEITKQAVLKAMEHPRDIDMELVDAYLARRALDYLVGFTLSPILWRKLPGSRSAGRVQSVALRLICDRDLEIEVFKPQEYWTVDVDLETRTGDAFKAKLVTLDGKKLDKFDLGNHNAAAEAQRIIEAGKFSVASVESRPTRRHPQPPFTTSTLQQEASRKLGFSASHTMRVAQSLYEGVDIDGETVGLITYMRTDGVQIADEAIAGTRDVIGSSYGSRYLPPAPKVYRTKAKNAQEAHEAIRPTRPDRLPADIGRRLRDDERKLYELVWKRTIASQMESAEIERTTVDISSHDDRAALRATGSVIRFDGFLTLYQEGKDDSDDENDKRLPPMTKGDELSLEAVTPTQHFTEPPPRFTEATLVKKLEELGIGRPSTYASILDVLRNRNYVRMEKNRFHAEDKGRLVTAFLESFFSRYVAYDFTAELEEQLDEVSAGKVGWTDLLRRFWEDFKKATDETKDLRITEVLEALNELLGPHIFPPVSDDADPRICPTCGEGRLSLKLGRYGAFVGCSNYPECRYTRQLLSQDQNGGNGAQAEERVLGEDPGTGREISLKVGRFGPYVELAPEDDEKPKRASIPKDTSPAELDLEKAIALLSLPREIGMHPETGKPIVASIGRYGPYVSHDGKYANLASTEEVFTVGANRAITLLAEAKEKSGRRGSSALRELGDHPDGGAIKVMNGRYGPYVTHNKVNATLPKDVSPEDVTLEQAMELLAKKAATGKTAKKKTAPKKAPAKKASTAKRSTTKRSKKVASD
ncbi:MAG TPA: type I DNA topoisomerase [Alphaproteobacteria bacterium]|nr:type I DNA topoisomerase [Alphaproteobacteria bacterium]